MGYAQNLFIILQIYETKTTEIHFIIDVNKFKTVNNYPRSIICVLNSFIQFLFVIELLTVSDTIFTLVLLK